MLYYCTYRRSWYFVIAATVESFLISLERSISYFPGLAVESGQDVEIQYAAHAPYVGQRHHALDSSSTAYGPYGTLSPARRDRVALQNGRRVSPPSAKLLSRFATFPPKAVWSQRTGELYTPLSPATKQGSSTSSSRNRRSHRFAHQPYPVQVLSDAPDEPAQREPQRHASSPLNVLSTYIILTGPGRVPVHPLPRDRYRAHSCMASINPSTPAAHVPEAPQFVNIIRDIHVANLCNGTSSLASRADDSFRERGTHMMGSGGCCVARV